MPRKRLLYALLLSSTVVAVACGGGAAAPTATQPAAVPTVAATPTPRTPQGTLIVAIDNLAQEDVRSYNYLGAPQLTFLTLFTDGLWRVGTKGERIPLLATGFRYSEDGKTLTIDLRKGVKFQNGEPFTAEDVRFTVQKAVDFRPTVLKQRLQQIRIADDHQIAFDFDRPYPPFLNGAQTGGYHIIPSKYYQAVGEDGYTKAPIGTGVFKLTKVSKGEGMDLEWNPGYWGSQRPDYQKLVVRLIPETTTRLATVITGETDMGNAFLGPQVEQIRKEGKLKEIRAKLVRSTAAQPQDFMYEGPSPLKDLRVREALEYAVDRNTIASRVYQGLGSAAPTVYADFGPGHDPNLKPRPYDVAKAKELLAAAGFPNGFKIRYTHSVAHKSYSEAVASYWKAVGVEAELVPLEHGTWVSGMTAWPKAPHMRGVASLSIFGYYAADPFVGPSAFAATAPARASYSFWSDPKLDAIFDEIAAALDPAKRDDAVRRAERYLFDNVVHIAPFYEDNVFAVGPKVKDWTPVPGLPNPVGLEWVILNR